MSTNMNTRAALLDLVAAHLNARWSSALFKCPTTWALSAAALIAMSVVATAAPIEMSFERRLSPTVPQRLAQGTATPASPPSAAPPEKLGTSRPQQEAPAAAAPASPSPEIASWQQALAAHLNRFKQYPARGRNAEGVVTVGFNIDRRGSVLSSRIVKSSGSEVLDAEALAVIKRAAPFPRPPAEIADSELSFVVPIRFAAR
jgi:periplasmic protein TonB